MAAVDDNMDMQEQEWVSVSTMAKRIGRSKQTVYNMIRKQQLEATTFERGKMRGILVRTPH